MNKRIAAFCLSLLFFITAVSPAVAYRAEKHNKYYERVLFGKGGVPSVTSKQETALTIIEYALYLSVDSFDYRGKDELDYLRSAGVNVLPERIDDFSFTSNQHHERYTHKGWEYTYPLNKAKWKEIRRPMLISAVNQALDFGFGGWLLKIDKEAWYSKDIGRYNKKCVSFAALLYYVHIVSDHAGNTYSTDADRMPLGHSNPGDTNRDVIFELQKHLPVIFGDQKDSAKYKTLMRELELKGKEIRDLAGAHIQKEDFEEYKSYAEDVMKILETYVPELLKNEAFFANVFYPEW